MSVVVGARQSQLSYWGVIFSLTVVVTVFAKEYIRHRNVLKSEHFCDYASVSYLVSYYCSVSLIFVITYSYNFLVDYLNELQTRVVEISAQCIVQDYFCMSQLSDCFVCVAVNIC